MHRPHPRAAALLAAFALLALLAGCGSDSSSVTTTAPSSESGESGASFAPQASLKAVGGTERTEKPEFVLTVEARPGEPNIRSVAVDLPPVVLVDTTALDVCPKSELESDECKGHTPLGSATALSPAFQGKLSGPVFVVSGIGRLPGLIYLLGGPAKVQLEGQVISKGGRIQAGVEEVPDTPLKSFELTIDGGKSGDLILSSDICQGKPTAEGIFSSHDGQTHRQEIPLEAECGDRAS